MRVCVASQDLLGEGEPASPLFDVKARVSSLASGQGSPPRKFVTAAYGRSSARLVLTASPEKK